MWVIDDPTRAPYARVWWISVYGVSLLGAVLGAAEWSVPAVLIGVVLDTLSVSVVWALFLVLAVPVDASRPPLQTASILQRALFLVSCGLAVGAFASLSVGLSALGTLVLLASSPVSLEWISRRRRRDGSPPSVPTGASS